MNLSKRSVAVLTVLTLLMLIEAGARRATQVLAAGHPQPVAQQGDAPAGTVLYFSAEKVMAAFAKGEALLGPERARNYSILAGRRDRPGEVETHTLDTDIFYVVEGSATFVTGGKALGDKETARNERRGTSIQGGEKHRLAKGDVIVIPNGVPHWFEEVQAPFLYYVVKVR